MFLLSALAVRPQPTRPMQPLMTGDMNMQVKSYLSFEGRCEEALDFYQKALGAKVKEVMRFKDAPEQPSGDGCVAPMSGDKIMHSAFQIGESELMATDGMNSGTPNFAGTSQALVVKTANEADRYFQALAEGGQVMMPLAKTFFSEKFGMTTDRFGVPWMIVVMP
ncbi:VOC family protein [Dongia sp.]|uniref:VOC family protein n=1 Tax=Dongia sp. TaxID=1977262 RepID=UPI0035B3FE6A